jgi:hypothetical protein
MKLDTIALDIEKAEQGISEVYPGTDIVLWTKRAWSPAFREVFQREIANATNSDGETPEGAEDRAIFIATIETCFVRWENVEGSIKGGAYLPTDEPLEYTPEVGLLLFDPEKTPAFEPLFAYWSHLSLNSANYRAKREEKTVGKSATSSDGS